MSNSISSDYGLQVQQISRATLPIPGQNVVILHIGLCRLFLYAWHQRNSCYTLCPIITPTLDFFLSHSSWPLIFLFNHIFLHEAQSSRPAGPMARRLTTISTPQRVIGIKRLQVRSLRRSRERFSGYSFACLWRGLGHKMLKLWCFEWKLRDALLGLAPDLASDTRSKKLCIEWFGLSFASRVFRFEPELMELWRFEVWGSWGGVCLHSLRVSPWRCGRRTCFVGPWWSCGKV